MERQMLAKFAVICALACASSGVCSAQVGLHSIDTNDVAMRSLGDNMDIGQNTFAFIGMPSVNGVTTFASDASKIQHQPNVNLRVSTARADVGHGYLPETEQDQANIAAYANSNGGAQLADNGTLLLITLGIAALGLSRRKIKMSAMSASNVGLAAEESDAENGATAAQRNHHDANSARSMDYTRTGATDRNPYPELRQSVQKLEALALEMQDRR